MSKANDFNYCPNCGAELPFDSKFCPDCGNVLTSDNTQAVTDQMHSRLKIVGIFSLIFAVFAIISGISLLASADAIITAMQSDADTWAQIIKSMADAGYTEAQTIDLFKSMFVISGAMALIAGISAGVGAVCSFIAKYWILGLIGLIVATVMMLTSIIGLIIGIIFIYLYVTCKPVFLEDKAAPKVENGTEPQ